eukprot:3116889-Amphidinium_carterae.1
MAAHLNCFLCGAGRVCTSCSVNGHRHQSHRNRKDNAIATQSNTICADRDRMQCWAHGALSHHEMMAWLFCDHGSGAGSASLC